MSVTNCQNVFCNEKHLVSLIATGLLVLSFATQGYAKDNSEAVILNYNWPVDLSGTIEIVENIKKIDSSGKKVLSHKGKSKITTEPHTDGLLVTVSNVDYDIDSTESERGLDPNFEKIIRVVMAENSWLVDPDGSFIDLVGADDLAARIKELIDATFADQKAELSGSYMETLIGMLETLLSKEQILESFATQWNLTVKQLDGARLQIGQPKEIEINTRANEIIGKSLKSIGTYELLGRLPCHDNDSENLCVEIKFTTELTEESKKILDESISELLNKMFEEMGKHDSPFAQNTATFDIRDNFMLITEPSTLVPHRFININKQSMDLGSDFGTHETHTEIITQYEYQ